MKRAYGIVTGFSLIEVMVTIALSTLVVYLLVINVSFLNRSLAIAELNRLCSVLRYLQRFAMINDKKQIIEFDEENNKYSFGGFTYRLPNSVIFGTLPGVKGPPSAPKKKIKSSITFKSSKIVFNSDGIIRPGTIYITDVDRECLYAISCSVAQVSYLRKYRYNGKWNLIS